MKRSRCFVAVGVGVGAMALGAGLAGQAQAQTGGTPPVPYCYLWGPPETGVSGPTFLPHASQMVRVYANSYDGTLAAQVAAISAHNQIINGKTDKNKICLVLKNSGCSWTARTPSMDSSRRTIRLSRSRFGRAARPSPKK